MPRANGIISKTKNFLSIVLGTLFHMASDPELVQTAFQNLAQQEKRRNLTLLGIVIGIAAIITLLALGQGLNTYIQVQFESLGLNTIYIQPGDEFGSISAVFSRIPERDIKLIEKIPYVEQTIPFYESAGVAVRGSEEASVFVIGVNPQHLHYLEESGYLKLKEGRYPNQNDVTALVVYNNFITDAYEHELGVRQNVTIKNKQFKIVGVSEESDLAFSGAGITNIVYTTKQALEDFFDETNPTEMIVIVSDKERVTETAKRIEQVLERAHGEKNVNVTTTENLLASVVGIIGVVQFFILAIAGVALLVGGIGIMNTMFMAVTERTREIGTMKALGATDTLIRSLFLSEAGIIGAVGGMIGIATGYLLAFGIGTIATQNGFALPITLDAGIISFGLVFSVVIGIVSGLAPAEKAIRLDPVTAIRYE